MPTENIQQPAFRRGDLFMADLDPIIGSEQGGIRPVLIIQNDTGNHFSPTVIVAAITSRAKAVIPTHIPLNSSFGLPKDSILMLEQLRTIDKSRLLDYIGHIDYRIMLTINQTLLLSLGMLSKNEQFYLKRIMTLCPVCAGKYYNKGLILRRVDKHQIIGAPCDECHKNNGKVFLIMKKYKPHISDNIPRTGKEVEKK